MAEIPSDLMLEILLRLPAMSLLRLRCVSKAWRDLIDSPNFAKSHLNNLSDRPPSLLITRRHLLRYYYYSYDVVDLSLISDASPLSYKKLPFPAHAKSACYVGHCNGLICISERAGVLLWNPATRKRFVFELPWQGFSFRYWGFGYDNDSDDYKIAAMAEVEGQYLAWIYSLRSRSWNQIDDFPDLIDEFGRLGVFVNGALHWPVRQGAIYISIRALHLGKLEYSEVPTPECSDGQSIFKRLQYLGVLDGRLCAVYYDYTWNVFELWIMKEYGVKESWTNLIRRARYTCNLIPLTYIEDNEALLFTLYSYSNEILRFDLKTGSFKKLVDGDCLLIPHVYVPSLICPHSGN